LGIGDASAPADRGKTRPGAAAVCLFAFLVALSSSLLGTSHDTPSGGAGALTVSRV
jgi:hypothetical protein